MHTPASLAELTARLCMLHHASLRRAAQAHQLKAEQLQLMDYLSRANPWSDTVESSAAYLRLTKGTVSQSISSLVKRGLLAKHVDTDDHRVRHCTLTPKGRALVEEVALGDPFHELPAHMVPLLTPALRTLLDALERAPAEQAFGACGDCAHRTSRDQQPWCAKLERALQPEHMHKLCRFWSTSS